MNFLLRLLICSFVGFALQVLLFFVALASRSFRMNLYAGIYLWWVEFGGSLDRSSGSGGHAFQGGAILGFLLGVLVYSLLIGLAGAVICTFKKKQLSH